MRFCQTLVAIFALAFSGCWTSYRYRATLKEYKPELKLANEYCITRVAYCPWPLEGGVSEEFYENLRASMERALRETHPELFISGGVPIEVSIKSVATKANDNEFLTGLNAMASFFTLGIIPGGGDILNDYVVSVKPCGKAIGANVQLHAENFSSLGPFPTALLYGFSEVPDCPFAMVGKSGMEDRDRRAELLLAKAFGAGIIQELAGCEKESGWRVEKKPTAPNQLREQSVRENTNTQSDSLVEVEQIPL